jgi:hypothetical protein
MFNYEPLKIKFIIDISKQKTFFDFDEQKDKMILFSTDSVVILTNVCILLSKELYDHYNSLQIKNKCVNIKNIANFNKIINNRKSFLINENNYKNTGIY